MNEENLADSLHQSVEMIEEKLKLAGSSLARIVDEVENVFRSLERLVSIFQDNKQTLSDLTKEATDAVSPAVDKGRSFLKGGASRASENPIPVILGAALVIGGLGLLGYYLGESGISVTDEGLTPRSPEPTPETQH